MLNISLKISLLIFVSIQISFAQQTNKKFDLIWNDNAKIIINSKKTITLPLLNNNLFDKNNTPTFHEKWLIEGNLKVLNYTIKNIVFKTISASKYPKSIHPFFPNKLTSTLNVKKDRTKAYVIFNLTPLVFENGQLKKIISFELEYNLAPKLYTKNFTSVHDSPLAFGNWYKFAIDTTGVFKIDKTFLQNLGINPTNINPKNIQIFGNGGAMLPELNGDFRHDDLQENAIYITGEADGVFNDTDYILFYGQGSDNWIPNLGNETAKHQKNFYSNKAYYFLTIGNQLGKRITNQPQITALENETITSSNSYMVHEKDLFNIDNIGQEFFGERFDINNEQSFHFNFTDLDITQNINILFKVATTSTTTTNFNLSIDNQSVIDLSVTGIGTSSVLIGKSVSDSVITTVNNELIQTDVTFDNQGNPSAGGFLDYIEINGIKKLIARDKQFSFRNYQFAKTTSTTIGNYIIENNATIFQIWNITDPINPTLITNQSTNADFSFKAIGGNLQEYILLNEADYYIPEILNRSIVNNQNLHALQDIDYLIITKKELVEQATKLANYHQTNSNLNTLIVTEEVIYNEFSSGSKDATAIRDFIRHLYANASDPSKRIKYVLFFGDTSFDFKNIEGNNNDINVISFQSKESFNTATSYVTDDFFGMMDDNEGDFSRYNASGDLQDVAISRMPVKNVTEASNAIKKTISYYNKEALGAWRNQISLVSDDLTVGKPSEISLVQQMEVIADLIKINKPVYNIKKIYADAFVQEITAGGESYPQVKIAINDAMERGSLLLDYFGHGGENGWANERFLDIPQIRDWSHPTTLPLFITITCEFSRYDSPIRNTAGELVFSNTVGGATNMITTARAVYISVGAAFNIDLIEDLLDFSTFNNYSITQSLVKTKNRNSSEIQRLFITSFGDPALKLAKPKANVTLTKMNGVDVNQQLDTIKALSHVYFEGIITDENNTFLPNFNGELTATIYDKSANRTTLNNDNNFDSNSNPSIITFDTRESKIFKGKASIVNGNWQFDFIAPRDIRIAYGEAKLSFYAENQIIDKNGYNTNIIIGGINYNAPADDTGPTIRLFMNDESFIDGGNTNQSPLFLAYLEDESGINTSLTAVDHDIVAILDGDQSNPIVLNDYYETELNDFKKGIVSFPFKDLEVGLHTIHFKCWDTYNNPSEATLNFVVVSDSDLVLDNVLNYPNPFINYTEFWFNHNKPNETLEAQVQIFTISGKLIKTINQTITTNGTLSRSIHWNGLDDFGNKIGKGVYIYKLKVKVVSSGQKSEKIEKLVILQ